MLQYRFVRAAISAVALTVPFGGALSPALAQAVSPETPSAALAREIRILASDPRNFDALVGAGRAALDMGDVQAAAGFFGRAQELRPTDWRALVGVGGAMVQMGDVAGGVAQFEAAKKAGAPLYAYAIDLGMAHDLQGKLSQAQTDYRAALGTAYDDEARRRLALSLAMSGKLNDAISTLQPLLNRRDTGAQRSRAFVFALVGQRAQAAEAIEQVMPGASARFEPFFRYLPNLSVAERAAAVHLGVFPEDASTRIAAAVPLVNQPTAGQPAAVKSTPPLVQTKPVKMAEKTPPRRQQAKPQTPVSRPTAAPTVSQPAATTTITTSTVRNPNVDIVRTTLAEQYSLRQVVGETTTVPQPGMTKPTETASATGAAQPGFSLPSAAEAPEPLQPALVTQSEAPASDNPPVAEDGRLSGIDKLLATIAVDEPPPAPQPKIESKKVATQVREAKLAEAKKIADKKIADAKAAAKAAADKKAREEAALGTPGTNWIQLAGGSNRNFMSTEYKKLSAKSAELKRRSGYVTEGKDYFRLLIGPFDSKADAQAVVNKLAKDGVRGFSWTRTPAQIRIEKLP
nr:SPOR domain-containing protein [uncultured Sphingomonas sp.]